MDKNNFSGMERPGSVLVETITTFMEQAASNSTTTLTPVNAEDIVTNFYILQQTRFLVQRILVPLIVITGLSGNLVSIAVLTNPSMKSSTNCYLTFLAVFDSLYLISSFTLSFNHYEGIKNEYVYKCWYPYGRVLSDMWSNASVVLTVTFTVERYIAVCHPMKGRVICTPKRPKIIAFVVAFCAFACTVPEFFEWTLVRKTTGNVTTVSIQMSKFAQQESYSVGYYYFLAITFTFIPLLSLCSFNSMLIRSVCRANEIRKVMTHTVGARSGERRQWEQHKTTLMLIGVAVVFIICQLPSASLIIYNTYIEAAKLRLTGNQLNNLRIAGNISNILIQINAAMNFILYSVMSTKFRRVFIRMMYRVLPGKTRDSQYRDATYLTGISFSKSTNVNNARYRALTPISRHNQNTLFRNRRLDISPPTSSQYRSTENLNESTDSIEMKDRIFMKNGNAPTHPGTIL